MIHIVNKKTYKRNNRDCAIYCGRPSILGNPYQIGIDGTRKEVIEKYEIRLNMHLSNKQYENLQDNRLSRKIKEEINNLLALLKEYGDLYLICWCAPDDCHVRIIKEVLEKRLANEIIG